jgi:PAS domain S-box-containing protein
VVADDRRLPEERLSATAGHTQQSSERSWLETVLSLLPIPVILCEAGTGSALFANPAADRAAGGHFPLGLGRLTGDEFFTLDPETDERLPPHRAPSMRASQSGERVRNVRVDWQTPEGRRSMIASADMLPGLAEGEPLVVVCFEDVTELQTAQRTAEDARALLDTLFERAPVGFAYFDRDLRYVRVNEALAEINGIAPEAHVGRSVDELLPDMDPAVVAGLRNVLATGEPLLEAEVNGFTPAQPGEQRTWLTGFYPVKGSAGEILGLGAVVVEITARKRAEAERERALAAEREARAVAERAATRAEFLAGASVAFDRSLDYSETLRNVARLAVPAVADWCAVDVLAEGELHNVAVTHTDPEKVVLGEQLMREFYYPPDAPNAAPAVMRTGRSELLPDITDELLELNSSGPAHLDLLKRLGMRSLMVVPMLVRGQLLGTITFVSAESGRRFTSEDLTLAEDLARRGALAIDNARLYSERAHIARTLQESLLPSTLPDIDGIEVAARYTPAGAGIDVGGDFYDVFETTTGTWSVVIGDVCGKGADAAALTALARYTIRATAPRESLPSRVLETLNEAVLRQRGDGRFITLAYATLEPAANGHRLTLSLGGHPPPIVLRADGTASAVGTAGTLIGVVPDVTLSDTTIDLEPGDTLFLYTDGVTEAQAPEQLLDTPDVEQLVAEAAASGSGSLSDLVDHVESSVRGAASLADDLAILALRVGR